MPGPGPVSMGARAPARCGPMAAGNRARGGCWSSYRYSLRSISARPTAICSGSSQIWPNTGHVDATSRQANSARSGAAQRGPRATLVGDCDIVAQTSTHMDNTAFVAPALLTWHARHGRHDLPWQRDPTPYRVWVSEIMLQQTQVGTVVNYYDRFMQRFPDIETLAVAPVDEVLHLWSGLGYYSRARNLHRAAQLLVSRYGGTLPGTAAELAALPGLAPSTAAAIRALSSRERGAILDGNVRRVLARCFLVTGALTPRAAEERLWQLAEHCTPQA